MATKNPLQKSVDDDYSIPVEIARLSSYQSVEGELSSLLQGQQRETPYTNESDGHGPQIQSIKDSISALRPYLLKQVREGNQPIQTLEVFPSGESGYKKSTTLSELFKMIEQDIEAMDKAVAPDDSNEAPFLPPNNKYARKLRLHDLRNLEERFAVHDEPSIRVRRHVVLISMNPIRVVVLAGKAILIVPDGADSLLFLLQDHIHDLVDSNGRESFEGSPEFRIYKAVFATLSALHFQEYRNLASYISQTMKDFRSSLPITVPLQEKIRALKTSINSRSLKVESFIRTYSQLLENNNELIMMCLSSFRQYPKLYDDIDAKELRQSSSDLENLVDSYLDDYNSYKRKLDFLLAQIHNMEDLIRFKLDTARNELLIVDASMNMIMAGVAIGALVASIFGMNINNGLIDYDEPYLFWAFSLLLCSTVVLIIVGLFRYFDALKSLPSNLKDNIFETL